MLPENNPAGSAEEWLRYANSDLELIRMRPPPSVLLEAFCFHAQQAVEKSLKAILIAQSVLFPRTHNIGTLLDLLAEYVSVPEEIREAASLTDYAVITRYPGAAEPVDEEEYKEAVNLAEAVVSWAEKIIRQ
ncbi:MAG: HEPN domain-containing protein [Gammaproteobacteria bacterium]|nr:HEPN domain-containing protein [Gammaproteobacteria bacterium]